MPSIMENPPKNRTAFTMIELVFIIVILGILASIAMPKMSANREDAEAATWVREIRSIKDSYGAHVIAQEKRIEDYRDIANLDPKRWRVDNWWNGGLRDHGHMGMYSIMPNVDTPWGVGSGADACVVISSPNSRPASLTLTIRGNMPSDPSYGKRNRVCMKLRQIFGGDLSQPHTETIDFTPKNVQF